MNKNKSTTNETTEKKTEEKVENPETEIAEEAVKEAPKSASQQLTEAILRNPKVAIFIGHILNGENPGTAATEAFNIKSSLINIGAEEIASAIDLDNIDAETRSRFSQQISSLLADTDANKSNIISLLAKGMNYEDAITANYVKGRNEKIELEKRTSLSPAQKNSPEQPKTNGFLENSRKSIWDY